MANTRIPVEDARRFDGSWTVRKVHPGKANTTIDTGAILTFEALDGDRTTLRLDPDPSKISGVLLSLQDGELDGQAAEMDFHFWLVPSDSQGGMGGPSSLLLEHEYGNDNGAPDNGGGTSDPG